MPASLLSVCFAAVETLEFDLTRADVPFELEPAELSVLVVGRLDELELCECGGQILEFSDKLFLHRN